jgi:hypothetical protein
MDRRDFIHLGTLLGAGLLPESLVTGASAFAQVQAQNRASASASFWQNGIQQVSRPVKLSSARNQAFGEPAPGGGLANPGRNPVFAFWDPTTRIFSDATDITPEIDDGDVTIDINVARFRPSTDDTANFNRVKSGSLRIDVSQQQPTAASPGVGQLAWSALAGLLPGGNGRLPSLNQLQFDTGVPWGNPNNIILTGGSGTWAWNFFLQKKESIWETILGQVHNAIAGGAPSVLFTVLGLPAISVTALNLVDKLVSYLTNASREEWLFNCPRVAVTATKHGAMVNPNTVRLKTGWYLVVPQTHATYIPTDASLKITNAGCLVGRDTPDLNQYNDGATRNQNLTYLTIYVTAMKKTG